MYRNHDVFKKPDNEYVKIWRYMDFFEFVDLLERKSLYFIRIDKLPDPFEGKYSEATILQVKDAASNVHGLREDVVEKLMKSMDGFRKHTIVNCWHENEFESAAMWGVHLKSGEGVAIQSTFKKLAESVRNEAADVYVGEINYIDFRNDPIPVDNLFHLFMHKRKSYESERELRAIITNFPIADSGQLDLNMEPMEDGRYVPVDLDTLIEKVYVAPALLKWKRELVKSLALKYGLGSERIENSGLDERPTY